MKDPTVLIYMDKWIASTNGMPADCRAWYFDLLVHQYDKGSIPGNIDELAGICRVRPSEYNRFEQVLKQMLGQVLGQVLEQVVKQKFKVGSDGTYFNEVAAEILKKQEHFLEKREKSGNIGYIIKLAKSIKELKISDLEWLKNIISKSSPDQLNQYKSKQVLEQVLENIGASADFLLKQVLKQNGKVGVGNDKSDHYIYNSNINNINTPDVNNINISTNMQNRKNDFLNSVIKFQEKYSKEICKDFFDYWTEKNEKGKKMRFEMEKVFDISRRLATWKKNESKFHPKNKKNKTNIDIDSIDHHAES